MKRSPVIIIIFTIAALLAATGVLLISGCKGENMGLEDLQDVISKGPPEIEEAVLASGIDENYNPVGSTEVFPSGTESIFLTLRFKNFTTDDRLEVVWTYLDAGTELSTQEYIPETDGSGNHYFNINNPDTFQPGRYSVRINFNGEIFDDMDFIVE